MRWTAAIVGTALLLLLILLTRAASSRGDDGLGAPLEVGLPPAPGPVDVVLPGASSARVRQPVAAEEGLPRPAPASLPREEIAFFGIVVEAASGAAPAGVTVTCPPLASESPWPREEVPAIRVGENGAFEVRHAPPAGRPLRLGAPGFAPVLVQTDTLHDVAARAAEIRLGLAGSLAVRVVDAVGTGMEGLTVHLRADALSMGATAALFPTAHTVEDPRWEGTTDDFGEAVLEDLPIVPLTGELRRGSELLLRAPAPLQLRPGERTQVVWSLGGGAVVFGRVRTIAGEPVPDAEVWRAGVTHDFTTLFGPRDGSSVAAKARTDANGNFTMRDVRAGRWRIGLAPRPELTSETVTIDVEPAAPVAIVDLLAHAGVFLRGKVVDPDDRPLPNIRVLAKKQGTLIYHEVDFTAADGSFQLGPTVAGTFEIGSGPGPGDLMPSDLRLVEAGEEGVVLRLRAGGMIEGVVVDAATGELVPASVHAAPVTQGRDPWGMQRILSQESSFLFRGLERRAYHRVAHTTDGRIGEARAMALPLGKGGDPVEVRVAPGAKLDLINTGERNGVFGVYHDEVPVAGNGLPAGSRIQLTVPAGVLSVTWSPSFSGETFERSLTVVPLETIEVRFHDLRIEETE